MSIGDSQSSLSFPVPQNVGFSTKGSLDWVSLITKPLTFSVEALSRLAAAGVDPYSLSVGQAIARKLPLGTVGRENVAQALSGLHCYGGLGTVLSFGFGIKSFVRVLGVTNEGRNLLAICSALSESFHVRYSAEVFHQIVLLHKPPGEFTPSAHEWFMIVRECSGVFARTRFPVLAEGFMRLVHNTERLTAIPSQLAFDDLVNIRGCPRPEDLAESILGIGKVKTGEYHPIAIHGCAAVGWLAAIAEWLYDLTVTIRDTDGNILYSKSLDPLEAQIQIMYDERTEGSSERSAVQVVSKTYQLHDYSQILELRSRDDKSFFIISGRLVWRSCLSSAFGADFTRLLNIPMAVGTAIGCAARIYKAIANAETELDPKALLHCRSYFDASSGQGFIVNILQWFPELEVLRRHMDKGVRSTLSDAKTTYEGQLAGIQKYCSCDCCRSWKFYHDGCKDSETFCLVILFETILVLCRILSGIRVAEDLLPMRAGFEAVYLKQWYVRGHPIAHEHTTQHEVMGPFAYVIDTGIDTKTDQTRETRDDNVADRRVVDALRLFTGRGTLPQSWLTVAQSVNGICAYLDILKEFSLDSECVGLVNVTPGRIERDHMPFSVIEDLDTLENYEQPLLSFLSKSRFDNVSMLLTETVDALRISFKLGNKSLQAGKPIQIGPAKLVRTVAEARGLVPCTHRNGKREIEPEVEFDKSDHPVLKFVWNGITVNGVDCHDPHDYFLAVALMQARGSYNCVLCQHECLQCCLNYAYRLEREGETTMIFLRLPSFSPGVERLRISMGQS